MMVNNFSNYTLWGKRVAMERKRKHVVQESKKLYVPLVFVLLFFDGSIMYFINSTTFPWRSRT